MENKNFSQTFFTPETSLEEIETRIYLDYKTREIASIRKKMIAKRKQRFYMRMSSVAASLLIFFTFSFASLNLSADKIVLEKVDKYSYLYRNSENIKQEHIPLQNAIALMQKSEFKAAIQLLEVEKQDQFADHFDWYLGLAYLGANDFENADKIFQKIEKQPSHLYHQEISTYFNFQLSALKTADKLGF